jgi:6-phosphogluconolactonase
MRVIVTADPEAAAQAAAAEFARACATAVTERGRACLALSGGQSPRRAFELFADAPLPWADVYVAQVDERCVPRDDARRNRATLEQVLVERGPLPRANLLAMPVDRDDVEHAAIEYSRLLAQQLGPSPRFDLVHLGLGEDGHTASLVPGDAALDVDDRDVTLSATYQGTRRMTLTVPALRRARERLWLVTGEAKATALAALLAGSADTPAARVLREDDIVVADRAASGSLSRPGGRGWG